MLLMECTGLSHIAAQSLDSPATPILPFFARNSIFFLERDAFVISHKRKKTRLSCQSLESVHFTYNTNLILIRMFIFMASVRRMKISWMNHNSACFALDVFPFFRPKQRIIAIFAAYTAGSRKYTHRSGNPLSDASRSSSCPTSRSAVLHLPFMHCLMSFAPFFSPQIMQGLNA